MINFNDSYYKSIRVRYINGNLNSINDFFNLKFYNNSSKKRLKFHLEVYLY